MTEKENNSLEFVRKEVVLNRPQLRFTAYLNSLTGATSIWGRGTGKSFIIAMLIDLIVKNMPGSSWAIQGATFKQILTLTLPGTLAALERLGYHRGIHYTLRKAPPQKWKLPYQAPINFEHYITFYNKERCVGFHLYSQDREGASRGPSVDGIIADEGLMIEPNMFYRESKMTNRGNDDLFGKISFHHGIFIFSSMPYGSSGDWMLKNANYYEEDNYNFRKLSNDLAALQIQFLAEKDIKLKLEIYEECLRLQTKITFYKSTKGHLYSEASSFENLSVLGLRYIQEAYDDAVDEMLFLVEVLNKRIEGIATSFYPGLDRNVHGYKGSFNYNLVDGAETWDDIDHLGSKLDKDCVSNHPLELGLDFGKINWIVIAQNFKSINRLNFIRNIYVKSPKIIDDLALEFCNIYQSHGRKVAHIWPDAMGNDTVANAKMTYVQQFASILKKNDWTVIIKNKGKKQPEHHYKYLLWARCLSATANKKNDVYPTVMFNLINCKELFFAMGNTGAIDAGNNLIAKDKSSERKLSMEEREKATDSTDAADQILFGLYKHLVKTDTPSYRLPQ